MIVPERHSLRILNLPETLLKSQLSSLFTKKKLKYNKLYFATSDGFHSAGFAFIDFNCLEDMLIFQSEFTHIYEDIVYNHGKTC